MAWIELQQSLWTHRKTYALAESLSIDVVHAGGLVARLWCWALDNAGADFINRRGLLTDVVPLAIAGGAGWNAEPACFVNALIGAGFLEHDGEDLVIHDWWDYSGRLLERRRRERERKQKAAAAAAKKASSRPKPIPQERTRKGAGKTPELSRTADAESVLTVPTLLTESLNSTEMKPPQPPASDDAGGSARAEASIELRAVPKPWEVARATCEVHLLYPVLAELFGSPPRPKDWEALRDDLLAFDALGATPDGLRRRVANWTPVMGRRPDGSELFMSRDALITHWARLGVAPAPAPTRPPEVRGMVVPIPPPPRMTREQAAAYRREILDSVRRKETPDEYSPGWLDDIAARRVSAAGGGDAVPAGPLGGDSRPPGG